MKKIIILFFISAIYSQGVGLNISLIGHLPRGEFKEELNDLQDGSDMFESDMDLNGDDDKK